MRYRNIFRYIVPVLAMCCLCRGATTSTASQQQRQDTNEFSNLNSSLSDISSGNTVNETLDSRLTGSNPDSPAANARNQGLSGSPESGEGPRPSGFVRVDSERQWDCYADPTFSQRFNELQDYQNTWYPNASEPGVSTTIFHLVSPECLAEIGRWMQKNLKLELDTSDEQTVAEFQSEAAKYDLDVAALMDVSNFRSIFHLRGGGIAFGHEVEIAPMNDPSGALMLLLNNPSLNGFATLPYLGTDRERYLSHMRPEGFSGMSSSQSTRDEMQAVIGLMTATRPAFLAMVDKLTVLFRATQVQVTGHEAYPLYPLASPFNSTARNYYDLTITRLKKKSEEGG